MHVHVLGVVRQPELPQHRDPLRRERLIQFDNDNPLAT